MTASGCRHHLGTILMTIFPPGSHQEASRIPKAELGKDCPSSSSRRLPAQPLFPSEPLELPGTESLLSDHLQVLHNQWQEQYLPLSRPGSGTPRTAQVTSCPESQHLVQPPGELQHPSPPVPEATPPLERRSWAKPGRGLWNELEYREQNPKPEPGPRCPRELSEHTPHLYPMITHPLES